MSNMLTTIRQSSKYFILIILILTLWIRLDFISNTEFAPVEYDQKNYTEMAVRILDEGVYGYNKEGLPDSRVTPGYPIFLTTIFALFGYSDIQDAQMNVRYVQAFLSPLYVWFIYLIGLRLFNRATGLLAALAAAVYGTYIFMSSLILTETIFLISMTALVYFQVRIMQNNRLKDHLWGGAILGIMVLIRPNSLILAATPYIFLMFKHRKLMVKQILWGVGAFAIVMMPWWIRNLITFNEFIFISNGVAGNALLAGTDPYFYKTIPWNDIKFEDQGKVAIERIKEGLRTDPLFWIQWFTIGKSSHMFLSTYYLGTYSMYVAEWYSEFIKFIHRAYVYIGIGGGFIAMFWNRTVRFLFINFSLLLVTQLMFIPEARYTIGMMPYLMLITAYLIVQAVNFLYQFIKNRKLGGSL
jgi:Dolichyl-phosphate-mannose-protein mannosyltransferase